MAKLRIGDLAYAKQGIEMADEQWKARHRHNGQCALNREYAQKSSVTGNRPAVVCPK